ncbi:hypothetical protein F5Y16DRAFT_399181 [Xylariaceae sp. FL0255]|nr:hypothetical protein F5Y16DRAFT_399181 [Xylariaceae sp. FL0255]
MPRHEPNSSNADHELERRRELVRRLKVFADNYTPSRDPTYAVVGRAFTMSFGSSNSQRPSKRELYELVTTHCDVVRKPNDPNVKRLKDYVRSLDSREVSQLDYHAMRGEFQLKGIKERISQAFFFGLLTREVTWRGRKRPLVRIHINKGNRQSLHGRFSPGDCSVELFVYRTDSVRSKMGSLAHEDVHAFMFIFSNKATLPNPEDGQIHDYYYKGKDKESIRGAYEEHTRSVRGRREGDGEKESNGSSKKEKEQGERRRSGGGGGREKRLTGDGERDTGIPVDIIAKTPIFSALDIL